MNTIVIATSKFGNPVTNYYKELGHAFSKKGYKVIYVFDGSNFETYSDEKFTFFSWPSKRPTKFKDFIFFIRLIKKHKPNICLSNFGSTNVVSLASYFCKVKNILNYVHTTTTQLKTDNQNKRFKTFVLKSRKKIIYNLCTHFLTNSTGNKKDFAKNYSIEFDKISTLPLLIKNSNSECKSLNKRDFSICIVGRLHNSKGHKRLFEQFKPLSEKYPNLILKVVGDGYLEDELKESALKLDMSNRVLFLGHVSNSQIGEVFSNSLMNISSSIDEAYGLVNIEALREGTPLLCTKTAGSKDIVKPYKNGLIYDRDTDLSFKNSFETIYKSWNSYSQHAIETFKNNYSLNAVDKHCKLIIENCIK